MNSNGSEPTLPTLAESVLDADHLAARYAEVRQVTESLCAPLEVEDYVVQSMPDASPAKWHLAHTSWFFETFVLNPAQADGAGSPTQYAYLFNSYYNAVGERIARPERGLVSRPTVAEVYRYRAAVDERMRALLEHADGDLLQQFGPTIVLGLHHEQQHQELILTDLKHAFGRNPLRPVYREGLPSARGGSSPAPMHWIAFPGGLREIGHEGPDFAFDNESPRHRVFVGAFRLADRLVTNSEYLRFIEEGGYDRPEFWLSDGWNACQAQRWSAPLYWEKRADGWQVMTLSGMRDLVEAEPVCHVSYYEADAFARWAGARLPTEAEWEVAAEDCAIEGRFLESEEWHPASLASEEQARPSQFFGDVWQWTRSPYTPYPGFQPAPGALGEYNGKFMCNQMVLRGGSCVTPRTHIRRTYRNFFPPEARWQFSGIRLAQDS